MSHTSSPSTACSVPGPFEHPPHHDVELPPCPPWCRKDHTPDMASDTNPLDDRPRRSITHARKIGEGDSAVIVRALTEVGVHGPPVPELPARFTYSCSGLPRLGATAEQALALAANIIDAVTMVNSAPADIGDRSFT
jgi:hypothetical protein